MHRKGKLDSYSEAGFWASQMGRRFHLYRGALTGPQQDFGLYHVDWASACKNLLPKAVLFQELVTKDTLAHKNAQRSFDEEAQSLRKLKTSPQISLGLL